MFLDANIFIHAHTTKSREGELCAILLKRIETGEQKAHTSVLVMNEVLFIIKKARGFTLAEKAWNEIFALPNLEILPIDSAVLSKVIPFVKDGLEPTDAFHAACMKANGISTICSYDTGFDKISSIIRQEPK